MKTFEVPTRVRWTGERTGLVELQGKSPLHVSAPPELKGRPGEWTPEDLFVEALESCLMLTYASLCENSALKLVAYESQAVGFLVKGPHGFSFERVEISPRVEVEGSQDLALELLQQAKDLCMVGRSVACQVVVQAEIVART